MDEELKRWEDMELDCLLGIFQRLSLEDLTLGVPFVCKSWYKASLDPICWKDLNFQTSTFTSGGKFAKRFTEKYAISAFSFTGFIKLVVARSAGLAVMLKFPFMYEASIDDLVLASNKCPRLKVLGLPNLTPEDELQIPQLIGKWKELEQLEMELKPPCFLELMEEISVNCKKFSGLKMSGSIMRSDALAIVEFGSKLKWLDLSGSYLPKEGLLVVMKGCREIERLSVKCCIGFEVDKDVLEMASGIKVFEHEGSKLCDYYVYDNFDWEQLLYLSIVQ